MDINSVLSQAVVGAEKGLKDARQVSSQLAVSSPKPEEDAGKTAEGNAKVEKAADADLGNIVDVEA